MKKTFFLYTLTVVICVSLFSACEKDDFDPGATNAVELAGEWYVETSVGGQVALGYQLIGTFNTANNTSNEVWVDDYGHIWPFKVRAVGDIGNLSFSGADLVNIYTDTTTVSILEGRIIRDVATTSGGNRADSIYFRLEFSDDPGVEYEVAGYRRTGFPEDEH